MKKRFIPLVLVLVLFGLQTLAPASSADQRRRPPRRTVVVVHKGFPIRRPLRSVVIHPIRRPFRVAPRLFLPLVFWAPVLVAVPPAANLIVWEDAENLASEEDWTEFTLNCENTGAKLWMQVVSGNVRFDWAEVVFGNGEAQVVDMGENIREPGYYLVLDFANGRMVDHVRVLAKSETAESRVALKMQK
jgi:hypothetical protein